jgi:dTDP-4-dehydrorhamnose 3,5-epimerase
MIFKPLAVAGACLIEIEPREDHRGFFARSFSAREFTTHGLTASFVECAISYSPRRGTLRGLHMQIAPHAQAKLVRCSRGAIYDVIIDLRRESASYGQWVGVELSASGKTMLHVPEGFVHGFQTLTDNVEVAYQMSAYYRPEAEAGVRWNDPRFGITWPIADVILSERDRSFADFRD